MNPPRRLSRAEILTGLAQCIGTEKYTRLHPRLALTDGCVFLADAAGCYWLFDLIASCFCLEWVRDCHDLKAELEVVGSGAIFTLSNERGRVLYKQGVPYTDFPLLRITILVRFEATIGKHVALLPSED